MPSSEAFPQGNAPSTDNAEGGTQAATDHRQKEKPGSEYLVHHHT